MDADAAEVRALARGQGDRPDIETEDMAVGGVLQLSASGNGRSA